MGEVELRDTIDRWYSSKNGGREKCLNDMFYDYRRNAIRAGLAHTAIKDLTHFETVVVSKGYDKAYEYFRSCKNDEDAFRNRPRVRRINPKFGYLGTNLCVVNYDTQKETLKTFRNIGKIRFCTKCESKYIGPDIEKNFYRDNRVIGGLFTVCKSCHKERVGERLKKTDSIDTILRKRYSELKHRHKVGYSVEEFVKYLKENQRADEWYGYWEKSGFAPGHKPGVYTINRGDGYVLDNLFIASKSIFKEHRDIWKESKKGESK